MSQTQLETQEWTDLIRRVFGRQEDDRVLALLVDLPDEKLEDREAWRRRRELVAGWRRQLTTAAAELDLEVELYAFRNARTNNAPLPETAWAVTGDAVGDHVDHYRDAPEIPLREVFERCRILLAPTELSATAPLKLAAREFGFRAATMPRFSPAMTPALRLDYGEIDRRCRRLKALVDEADAADFLFEIDAQVFALTLDLRGGKAHVSSGLLREPGTAGNLPSGETYVVPYEGERPGDPSRTRGHLPVELDGEVVIYELEGNRATSVRGSGSVAEREAEHLRAEPAYGNVAELGLGVLADFGLEPIGEILLDEKMGLHIAFGRSDHFGGQVGPGDFSSPDQAVHIDRVYLPETQPSIIVRKVELRSGGGERTMLMRDGRYEPEIFARDDDGESR